MYYRIDDHDAFVSNVEAEYAEVDRVLQGVLSKTAESVLDVTRVYDSPAEVLGDFLQLISEFDSLKSIRRKEASAKAEFERVKCKKDYLESCAMAVEGLIEAYVVLKSEISVMSQKLQRMSLNFLDGGDSVSSSLDEELCKRLYDEDFVGFLDFLLEKREVLGNEYSEDLKLLLEEYNGVSTPMGFARFMKSGMVDVMRDGISVLFVKISNISEEAILELNVEINKLLQSKRKVEEEYNELISKGF